jgi:hypothetical protein
MKMAMRNEVKLTHAGAGSTGTGQVMKESDRDGQRQKRRSQSKEAHADGELTRHGSTVLVRAFDTAHGRCHTEHGAIVDACRRVNGASYAGAIIRRRTGRECFTPPPGAECPAVPTCITTRPAVRQRCRVQPRLTQDRTASWWRSITTPTVMVALLPPVVIAPWLSQLPVFRVFAVDTGPPPRSTPTSSSAFLIDRLLTFVTVPPDVCLRSWADPRPLYGSERSRFTDRKGSDHAEAHRRFVARGSCGACRAFMTGSAADPAVPAVVVGGTSGSTGQES